MSTIVEKEIVNGNSFSENGCGSNNSTVSSRDDFDDNATEFKPNLAAKSMSTSNRMSARSKDHSTMAGITIPHQGLTAAAAAAAAFHSQNSVSGGSIAQHSHYTKNANGNSSNNETGGNNTTSIINNSHSYGNGNNFSNYDSCKSPFLLPAQLYKSLFANAVLQNSDKMCSHPFPRNLLFSYVEKSPTSASDFDAEEKNSVVDEVSFVAKFCTKRKCSSLFDFKSCFFPFSTFSCLFCVLCV